MTIQISPRKEQLTDFGALVELPEQSLQKLIPSAQESQLMKPQKLEAIFAEHVGTASARLITRILLSILSVCRQMDIKPTEYLSALREGLQRSGWNKDKLALFDSRSGIVSHLLDGAAVRRVSMALSIAYEYENFFQWARIITDIRPIFSDDVTSVEGTLVTHTLRLRYDSEAAEQAISIAMDLNDIKRLQKQCERAVLKAQVAQELMSKKCEIASEIAGDSPPDEITS